MDNKLWVLMATIAGEVVYWSDFNGWGEWEDADLYTDKGKALEAKPFLLSWPKSEWLEYR